MLLLKPPQSQSIVALWGNGLIGQAIRENYVAVTGARVIRHPTSWANGSRFLSQLAVLRREIADLGRPVVNVVWAAGTAGFGSSEAETDEELRSFSKVVRFAEQLERDGNRVCFHLVSSAGGLFEGTRQIRPATMPCPKRPYGRLKAAQESMLAATSLVVRVYRPTSVYSYIGSGTRVGVIPALVRNVVDGREACLTASLDTLRDYVWAGDLGRFMAECLTGMETTLFEGSVTWILASERPTSLYEICRRVELVLMRPVRIRFDRTAWNSENITVANGCSPLRLRRSSLSDNIRQIYRRYVGSRL